MEKSEEPPVAAALVSAGFSWGISIFPITPTIAVLFKTVSNRLVVLSETFVTPVRDADADKRIETMISAAVAFPPTRKPEESLESCLSTDSAKASTCSLAALAERNQSKESQCVNK